MTGQLFECPVQTIPVISLITGINPTHFYDFDLVRTPVNIWPNPRTFTISRLVQGQPLRSNMSDKSAW